jgi:hypothetical protein
VLVRDCQFDGAFGKRDIRPGSEQAEPAVDPTGVGSVKRQPAVTSLDNMAQMPMVAGKSADRGRIAPCGCMELCGSRFANSSYCHRTVAIDRIVHGERLTDPGLPVHRQLWKIMLYQQAIHN